MVEKLQGLKVDKLKRAHKVSTPSLPLQFGEGRGEVFLRETPTHQMSSVHLCVQKRAKP